MNRSHASKFCFKLTERFKIFKNFQYKSLIIFIVLSFHASAKPSRSDPLLKCFRFFQNVNHRFIEWNCFFMLQRIPAKFSILTIALQPLTSILQWFYPLSCPRLLRKQTSNVILEQPNLLFTRIMICNTAGNHELIFLSGVWINIDSLRNVYIVENLLKCVDSLFFATKLQKAKQVWVPVHEGNILN